MFKTTLCVIAIGSVVGFAAPSAYPQEPGRRTLGALPSWATGWTPGAGGEKIYTDGNTWFHADHTLVETHGISNLVDYLCLVEKAQRYGSVVDVKESAGRWTIQWKNGPYVESCDVGYTERQAAMKLIDQRAIEAAEQKAEKAEHDAEQAAAEAQFLNSHLEAAKVVEEKATADKADAEKRIAEAHTAEAKANSERAEADRRIAEAQAAEEKVPELEKAAAERAALAEKAAAEKVEADRRISAANDTIEQANATIAAAQAAKDEAAAAERTAADTQKKAFELQPASIPTSSPTTNDIAGQKLDELGPCLRARAPAYSSQSAHSPETAVALLKECIKEELAPISQACQADGTKKDACRTTVLLVAGMAINKFGK